MNNKGDQSTVRPGNGATVRPNDGSTIRPGGDSTIRPGGDSTVRPGGGDSTVRPDSSSTVRPGSGTVRPQGGNNAPQTAAATMGNRQHEDRYVLNGHTYKTKRVLSASTGEAIVLLLQNGGKDYVMKLYDVDKAPVGIVMNTIKKLQKSGRLFAVLDTGMYQNRFYELMPYYTGTTLMDIDIKKSEKRLGELIAQMSMDIDFLHKNRIIHRDIKPSNFLFTDSLQKTLLLGDFGIAVMADSKGQSTTNQARSKTFAAPEVYRAVDGMSKISTKSDFYSLGMIILYLWMGRKEFNQFENTNEYQLADMKTFGQLPMPEDMSPRLKSLVKALTEPNPDNRPDFATILKWLQGENPFHVEEKPTAKHQFEIVFKGDGNVVCHSLEELAAAMYKYQDLATNYLYKGKIEQWVQDNGYPEVAMQIEDIVEKKYPRDKHAGLLASCYTLDPAMPFVDPKGKHCTTSEQLGRSIFNNYWAIHETIEKGQTEPDLFVFLKEHGQEQLVSTFKKDSDATSSSHALDKLIYTLNPMLPYSLNITPTPDSDDVSTVNVDTIDEILSVIVEQGWFTSYTQDDMCGEGFELWLQARDPHVRVAVHQAKEKCKGGNKYLSVLFALNPNTDIYFRTDKMGGYIYTLSDIAEYINEEINRCDDYTEDKEDRDRSIRYLKKAILDIKDSVLDHYLQSKGDSYAKYVDYIQYCANVNSSDNKNKAGFYRWQTAIFRIIAGMGVKPKYYFSETKTYVTTLDELKKIDRKLVEKHLNMDKYCLSDWLAIHFQENPKLNLKPSYTYEKELAKMLDFIDSLKISDYEPLRRYKKARSRAKSNSRGVGRKVRWLQAARWIGFALYTLYALALVVSIPLYWETGDSPIKFNEWVFIPFWIIGVIIMYIGDADGCTTVAIGGAIIAAILGGIFVLLAKFLWPALPWISAALVLLVVAGLLYLIYFKYPINYIKKSWYRPDYYDLEVAPLYYAFGDDSRFNSNLETELEFHKTDFSRSVRMWYLWSPLAIMMLFLATAGVLKLTGNEDSSILPRLNMPQLISSQHRHKVITVNEMQGEWVAHNDDGCYELNITRADSTMVKGTISLTAAGKPVKKYEFSGKLDTITSQVKLEKFKQIKPSRRNMNKRSQLILSGEDGTLYGSLNLLEVSDKTDGQIKELPFGRKHEDVQ